MVTNHLPDTESPLYVSLSALVSAGARGSPVALGFPVEHLPSVCARRQTRRNVAPVSDSLACGAWVFVHSKSHLPSLDPETKGDHLLAPLLKMVAKMGKPKGQIRSIRFEQPKNLGPRGHLRKG